MTKPITAVGLMMLVERGQVAVDTPVHAALPEFKDVGVYSGGGDRVPFMTTAPAEPIRRESMTMVYSSLT